MANHCRVIESFPLIPSDSRRESGHDHRDQTRQAPPQRRY